MIKNNLIIWRFLDGKPGHEKQSDALINELRKLNQLEVFEFHANVFEILKSLLLGHFSNSPYQKALKPDFILGVGHRTHISMLLGKALWGGNTIVIMRPTLPCWLFDLCLIPRHDNPPTRRNILPIVGSLNKVYADSAKEKVPGLCTLLIGGPSNHFEWSTNEILDQIELLTNSDENSSYRFRLATSRRTPWDFLELLNERAFPNLEVFDVSTTKSGWLEETLAISEYAFVTPDSISMIYEALSSKCRVAVHQLVPKSKNSRVVRNVKFLRQERFISDWKTFYEQAGMSQYNFSNQAAICATDVISRFLK